MPENWTKVAQEVAAAIADVGFSATVEQPGTITGGTAADPVRGSATQHTVTVIDDRINRRDGNGTVTETVRVLTLGALVVTPQKGWRVQVRGSWHRIAKVMPLAPGGVDLLFDVELEG